MTATVEGCLHCRERERTAGLYCTPCHRAGQRVAQMAALRNRLQHPKPTKAKATAKSTKRKGKRRR